MKKIFSYIILIIGVFSIYIGVNAQEYQLNTMIPVDTTATVKTEKFDYNDFVYKSGVDAKGNSIITFGSIKNNTNSKNPVSINILLFDDQQKNIGFLTYCSDKDVSSDYAGFKLRGGESSPFAISVTKRYFANVEMASAASVKYIAVMDDNKYCHIGGYDKYEGLTLAQITKGEVAESPKKDGIDLTKLNLDLDSMLFIVIVIGFLVLIGLFVLYGKILNALHKKMYAKTTILAYLPITNNYVTVKLAFGNIVALVYLVLFLLGSALSDFKINFLAYIVSFVTGISFILVIIKLITKNYDLFYFEPSIKNPAIDNTVSEVNDATTSNFISSDSQQTIDLNYDDVEEEVEPTVFNNNTTDLFNVSSGEIETKEEEAVEEASDDVNDLMSTASSNAKIEENKEGESDLSKFFQ